MNSSLAVEISRYVHSLRCPNGGFAFSRFAPDTILSTDFAVFTLSAIGQIHTAANTRDDIARYLSASRRADGIFEDVHFNPKKQKGTHRSDYILGQFTCYSLTALDMLGIHFHTLPFVESMFKERRLEQWLTRLDWSQFWYESNKIMFFIYYLAYLQKYSDDTTLGVHIEAELDTAFCVLNARQDPRTGLWGTQLNDGNIADGAFGAAHILLFYQYFNRPIPRAQQILDACLTLHASNGLIGSTEGGACEDYDIADIYLRILAQHPAWRSKVVDVLAQMKQTILGGRLQGEGFPYRIPGQSPVSRIRAKMPWPLRGTMYQYSSWRRMRTPVHQADLWGTFFRSLTLQIIDYIIDGVPLESRYSLPCWGYVGNPVTP